MENNDSIKLQSNSKRAHIEVDLANLPTDPFLRKKIYDYHHPSDRDNIQRAYLQKKKNKKKKGSCQPFSHNFPQTQFGKTWHRQNFKRCCVLLVLLSL
jgi:hypothetical protein